MRSTEPRNCNAPRVPPPMDSSASRARRPRLQNSLKGPVAFPAFAGDSGASKPPLAFRLSMEGRSPALIDTSIQLTRALRTGPASPHARDRSRTRPRTGAAGLTSRDHGFSPGPAAFVPGRHSRAACARQTAFCVLRQDLFGALQALSPAKNWQRGTLETDDNSSITTAARI